MVVFACELLECCVSSWFWEMSHKLGAVQRVFGFLPAALLFTCLNSCRWCSGACSQTRFQSFKTYQVLVNNCIWCGRETHSEGFTHRSTSCDRKGSFPDFFAHTGEGHWWREGDATPPATRLQRVLFPRDGFRTQFWPVLGGSSLQDGSEPREPCRLILQQWNVGIALSPNV